MKKVICLVLMTLMIAGVCMAETGEILDQDIVVVEKAQPKSPFDYAIYESTLSPFPGAFGIKTNPPAGFNRQDLVMLNMVIRMHREPFLQEELARMPGSPDVYENAVNAPEGLTPEEFLDLNESLMLWRTPYTDDELLRMPGTPLRYAEATNRPGNIAFSIEELSRMPGSPGLYEKASNPPAGLTEAELMGLNENISMWRMPYSQEELMRMPGSPATYELAFNPTKA